MGDSRATYSACQARWASAHDRHARSDQCHLVPGSHRLPMASLAAGVSPLVDGVELLPHLAQQWHLEAHAYGTARSRARETRARADAQRYHHRQPIGENESKRGRRGYDGGKRVKGRKRHVLVDTMGLIAGVLVHEANIQDHDGGKELLWPLKGCLPRLQLIWAVSRLQEGRLRRVGQRGTRLGSGDRGASLEWHARGLGTQGCRDRLGADPPKRLPCPQMALDRGAHVCLAFHLAQASL